MTFTAVSGGGSFTVKKQDTPPAGVSFIVRGTGTASHFTISIEEAQRLGRFLTGESDAP